MQIYFIRHAQSQNNALFLNTGGRYGRVSDPELTAIGESQTHFLASYLAQRADQFKLTHVYTSLMQRAIITAIPVADALGLPLRGEIDLHESGGLYLEDEDTGEPISQPGRNRMEFNEVFPDLILPEQMDGNGWYNRAFEPQPERPIRARRIVDWLLANHPDPTDHVAIFSHYGFFNYFLWALFGQVRPINTLFTIYNTSLSLFEIDEEGPTAVYINRVDHLPPELVTE